MADLADAEAALVLALSATLYPGGVPAGNVPPVSSAGLPVRIYRGWPNAAALDKDLAAGIANISVYSLPGMGRTTTRFSREWCLLTPAVVTITASVAGNVVTFGGAAGPGMVAGIRTGGQPYAYACQPTDGPAQVAAALAALVPGAVANGVTVTVPAALQLAVKVVGTATMFREMRRQVQGFKVTVWAPDQATRDAVARVSDAGTAGIDFLTLADGSAGRLQYTSTFPDDVPTKDKLWKRDLRYTVEYPTIQTQTAIGVLWPRTTITYTA